MKRTFAFIAFILSLAGCAKETFVDSSADAEGGLRDGGLRIIADVSKTAYADAGNDGLKTTWLANDAIGVYAYRTKADQYWLNYKGVAEADAEVASFKISEGYILAKAWEDYKIYGYYPYNGSVAKIQHMSESDPVADSSPSAFPITLAASQVQASAGDFSHLAASDFLYGYAVNQWDYNDETGESKKVHLNFHHALSVLEIALTSEQNDLNVSSVKATIEDENEIFSLSEGSIDLETGVITPVAGTPSINLNLVESVKLSSTPSKFYMQITPGHAGKVLSVYATVNGQTQKVGSVKVPAGGIPAGVNAKLSFNVEFAAVVDYKDLSAAGTANCYLVNTPGAYKFKATVKGNGNIPEGLSSANAVTESAIAPKSALMLWYNTVQTSSAWVNSSPVVISSVSLTDDGYITFYTPSELVPGNVVIAAFAEEGLTYDNITASGNLLMDNATILWSWNIWVADGYDPETANYKVGDYTFMNRNLGALIDGNLSTNPYELAASVGNHYQWGRKDPFPTFADYSSNNSFPSQYGTKLIATPTFTPIKALQINSQGANADLDGQMFGNELGSDGKPIVLSCVNYAGKSTFASSTDKLDVYLAYATKYPYKFIGGMSAVGGTLEYSNYNWYYKSNSDQTFKHLWGDGQTYSETRTVEKSLYDPCPAGWRVMTYEAAIALVGDLNNKSVVASNAHGIVKDGIYYPLTGRGREYGSFRIEYIGVTGYTTDAYFWHSTADKGYSGYYYPGRLSLSAPANYTAGTSCIAEHKTDRCGAQGLNVRCIKE